MATKYEYWFVKTDREGNTESGHVYHNEKLGRLIVFNGTVNAGDHFVFMNMESHLQEKSETTQEIVNILLTFITDSVTS